MIKTLHYSDAYSPDFIKLSRDCDVIFTTGDLSLSDFSGLNFEKPAFGVYGNHDSGNYMESLGITNVHNRVVDYSGLKIGGWQGCLKYKEGNYPFYTEAQAEEFAATFPAVDILLLHAGGRGLLDDESDETHIGSPAIRQYILDKQPKFVFCGHQYSNAEMEIGPTKIYRTYGARVIEI